MAKTSLKTYTLEQVIDEHIGPKGTKKRDRFDHKLKMEMLGDRIKEARQQRNLTQEQLGKLIGVQKAQVSKLEKGANSATLDTIIKVFTALKAEIDFKVRIGNTEYQIV